MKSSLLSALVISLMLFTFLGVNFYSFYKDNSQIYLINCAYIFGFYIIALYLTFNDFKSLSTALLISAVFCLIFGAWYVFAIYDFSGQLFQFHPSDAPFYDETGRFFVKEGLINGVRLMTSATKYGYDDMGMIVYVSLVYSVLESPISLKVVNLFINVISIILIYRTGSFIMDKKYAFLASLLFGLSSYNIWFLVSGLKEPLMVSFILASFYFYLKYKVDKVFWNLLLALLFGLALFFFRIPVVLFIFISFAVSEFLGGKVNVKRIIGASVLIVSLAILMIVFSDAITFYLNRSNPAVLAAGNEAASNINPIVSLISGIFGPFPTILPLPSSKFEDVSVYAPSLIIKVLLSIYFVMSLVFLFKEKKSHLLSLVAFPWIQIMALSIIDQTFKLRYVILHFPFIIILAVYAIQYLDKQDSSFDRYRIFGRLVNIGLVLIIFFWNYLRVK